MEYRRLGLSIVICLLAGFIGSIFTYPSLDPWYESLQKPFFTPPGFVFGPVWTILYILMGVSLYIVWKKRSGKEAKKVGFIFFFVQLGLNVLWSILFFGLQAPIIAFVEILLLWGVLFYTIILFRKISRSASYVLIPYLLWVTFATLLNFAIVVLN